MGKSYKRKNTRNKTHKKYNKVGGVDKNETNPTINSTSKISEFEARITDLEMNMPVCIGYKQINSSNQGGYSPLWVKRNIDSTKFWQFLGNGYNPMIDLDALCSLPNVRGLPLERCASSFMCENNEDQKLFRKRDIQKLEEKCPGLFVI